MTSDNHKTLTSYEGQWTGVSHVGGSKGPVFIDMTPADKEEVSVKGTTEQGVWESRRLWERVARGIRGGNYDEAGKEKTRIEVSSWDLDTWFFWGGLFLFFVFVS